MASECPNCHHATLHPQGMCLKPDCGCTSDVPMTTEAIAVARPQPEKDESFEYKIWYVRGGSAEFTVKSKVWRNAPRQPVMSKGEHYVEFTQVNGKITTIPWTSILQMDKLPNEEPDELDEKFL